MSFSACIISKVLPLRGLSMSIVNDGNGLPKCLSRDPSVEELRTKAEACREQARTFQSPIMREHLVMIALEYDRLAKRGEDYAARPNGDEHALKVWYPATALSIANIR